MKYDVEKRSEVIRGEIAILVEKHNNLIEQQNELNKAIQESYLQIHAKNAILEELANNSIETPAEKKAKTAKSE